MNAASYPSINFGVMCPMANEKADAQRFVTEVLETCSRYPFKSVQMFVVFDKACTDGTHALLAEMSRHVPQLKVVFAPENRCAVDAYLRGYQEALRHGCDWILEIDAGYSHQPSDIPRLLEVMSEGYDCVFGSRFCAGGRIDGGAWTRRLISRGGTIAARVLLGTKLSDMTSGFELFSAHALRSILEKGIHSRGPFFQTEIRTHAHAFRITEVPICYRSPSRSVGNMALSDAFVSLWRLYKMTRPAVAEAVGVSR